MGCFVSLFLLVCLFFCLWRINMMLVSQELEEARSLRYKAADV